MTLKFLRSSPWLGWPLWNICVTIDHGYVPLLASTSRSFFHSWLISGLVTRLTRRVSLVKQELLIFSEHLSSSPSFSGVRVTRSLVLCVCRSLFVLLYFFFWPLCCLLFFDIRILITPLVSSNSSLNTIRNLPMHGMSSWITIVILDNKLTLWFDDTDQLHKNNYNLNWGFHFLYTLVWK